ncbi:MAG: sigma-70 family RNA polymerase sigma factor, partial [Dietzia sp.]|nr:sigma-70 family RNA polymerase sigma factor [Dietzia sp.]
MTTRGWGTRRVPPLEASVDAFEEFFRCHLPRVRGFVARRVPAGDVDDVVAEVFVVAWRRFEELPSDASRQAGWLLGVARMTMLNHFRSRKRRRLLGERLSVVATEESRGSGVGGPDNAVVEAAFEALSDGDRLIVSLVAWDQCSTEELAEVLGCSPSAARTRL